MLTSQSLASELDACKEEITTLKNETSVKDQEEELKWYKDENTFLASQIFEMIKKFEQGSKVNHDLLTECNKLKRKFENSETKFQSLLQDYERAVRWINARKDLVKDYESCINTLGLESILEITNSNHSGNILSTKVTLIMKETSGKIA